MFRSVPFRKLELAHRTTRPPQISRVKLHIFSTHEMKYVWFLPKKT